ncbi:hypothetical protein CGT96_02710 [Vibrio metoecus]|nr:hypothetical protein CGT97_04690 [Vibrio metoecus]PAR44529.1 hypothetical protein CGT96_02710 [Vibrio metoecus]
MVSNYLKIAEGWVRRIGHCCFADSHQAGLIALSPEVVTCFHLNHRVCLCIVHRNGFTLQSVNGFKHCRR